jgi:hypothetical protein
LVVGKFGVVGLILRHVGGSLAPSFDSTTMSSTPKTSKLKNKAKDKRISTPATDERNDTPKPKQLKAMETGVSASPESGGNALWLVLLTLVTGLIAILAVCPFTLNTWSRWLQIPSAQVPGPAQDKAYELAQVWGIIGHSGASGVATPKVRTKVKILADEEKRDAIVHAFEVSLVLFSFFRYEEYSADV